MFTTEVIITIATHFVAFTLGVAFDRWILRRIDLGDEKVTIQWAELVRVTILGSMFFTFLASIISLQFFGGEAPNVWLSIGGIFSFGSLVGERDFFIKLLTGFIKK